MWWTSAAEGTVGIVGGFLSIIYSLSFQFRGCKPRWSHGFDSTAHRNTCEGHVTDLDRAHFLSSASSAKSKNYVQICSWVQLKRPVWRTTLRLNPPSLLLNPSSLMWLLTFWSLVTLRLYVNNSIKTKNLTSDLIMQDLHSHTLDNTATGFTMSSVTKFNAEMQSIQWWHISVSSTCGTTTIELELTPCCLLSCIQEISMI